MVVPVTGHPDVAKASTALLRGGAGRRLAAGGPLDHLLRDDVVRVLNRFARKTADECDASGVCEGKNAG
jgi:hypothetical protein